MGQQFVQLLVNGLITGSILALTGVGASLVFRIQRIANFAHGEYLTIGAYVAFVVNVVLHQNMVVAAFSGMVAVATDYLAIVTVAGGEIVRYLALNLYEITGGAVGSVGMLGQGSLAQYNGEWEAMLASLTATLAVPFGSIATRDFSMLLIVWTLALVILALFWVMVRSPWGRVLRSIREDEQAAAAVGKNVFQYKMQVLILGALLGGVAGLLLA
ncbi:MAG TPA: branched-chain amino acid ABC transporter permease, partial [Chloroflexota bacterium]|nr:branched-chain amino acid ABC transporter permease [Chloroflexota bacterium]